MSGIQRAVASMTAHGMFGFRTDQSRRILEAMHEAVKRAQAAGITDPEAIRHAQIVARDAEMAS